MLRLTDLATSLLPYYIRIWAPSRPQHAQAFKSALTPPHPTVTATPHFHSCRRQYWECSLWAPSIEMLIWTST